MIFLREYIFTFSCNYLIHFCFGYYYLQRVYYLWHNNVFTSPDGKQRGDYKSMPFSETQLEKWFYQNTLYQQMLQHLFSNCFKLNQVNSPVFTCYLNYLHVFTCYLKDSPVFTCYLNDSPVFTCYLKD